MEREEGEFKGVFMKVFSESEKTLVLVSEKETPALLNAARRAVISEVPCMAISEVDVYENNSALFNDYLANRVGLIPLTWEEGIDDDVKVTFSLNAEAVEEQKTVYSRDLVSSDEKIKVFAEDIPVAILNKGQKIRIEGFAVKGTAKIHARFQSALAYYGKAGEFKAADKCKKCSNPLIAFKPIAGKKDLPENSFLCANCSKPDGDGKEYLFVVESFNNLSSKEQYERALKVMEEKTKVLEKEFK